MAHKKVYSKYVLTDESDDKDIGAFLGHTVSIQTRIFAKISKDKITFRPGNKCDLFKFVNSDRELTSKIVGLMQEALNIKEKF